MAITAKFVADFSSFYAAVNKAEVELRSFETGASKVEKSLARMTDTFSGRRLIQEAALTTAAIEKIGGVSKLTEAELVRVSAVANDAADKMRRLGIEVPKAVQELAAGAKPATALETAFGGVVKQVGAMAAGFISAQAIIGAVTTVYRKFTEFVGSSIEDYLKAEAAQVKLNAALRTQGLFIPQVTKQYEDLAKQIQRTTVYDDDLIKTQEALLIQVGNVMPSKMKAALTAATDLASGLGIDLNSATLLVAKAAAGNTETLGRYGVTVSEAALKTQGFDAVLESIQRRFGGQAQAELETYAGRIKAAANAWSDVKEAIGGAIVTHPIITMALRNAQEAAQGAADAAEKEHTAFRNFAVWTIGPQAVGLIRFFTALADEQNKWLTQEKSVNDEMKRLQERALPAGLPDKTLEGMREAAKLSKDDEEATKKAAEAQKKAAESAKVFAEAQVKAREALIKSTEGVVTARVEWKLWQLQVVNLTSDLGFMSKELDQAIISLEGVAGKVGASTLGQNGQENQFLKLQKEIDAFEETMNASLFMGPKLPPTFGKALVDGFAALPSLLVDAFTGGGDWKGALKAVSTTITMDLFGPDGVFAKATKSAKDGLSKLFGSTIGDALGGALPGIGALIGPAITGIGKLFGKIFGKSETSKVNDMRDAFEDTFGTLGDMAEAFRKVGLRVEQALNAKKITDFQAVMDEFNRRLEFQASSMDAVKEAADRYGFALSELGPALQRQNLDEQAQQLLKDFQLLTGAGIAADVVLGKMGGSFNDLVQNAANFGIALPSSLRPALEQMAALGLLTDTAGNKMDQAAVDGLNFTDDLTKGMKELNKTIREMVDSIQLFLGIKPAPINVPVNFQPNYPQGYPGGASTGGQVTESGIQKFGMGGRVLPWKGMGSDRVPAMLTPGEMVLNANQQKAVGALMRGGGSTNITIQAWDGPSVDQWLRNGGAKKIAGHVVPNIPGVLRDSYGMRVA